MTPDTAPEAITQAARIADAVAAALAKYDVAYSHVTLADFSTGGRTWSVHETGHGNPFVHDVWLGRFDNKAEADALAFKLRREEAVQAVRRLASQDAGEGLREAEGRAIAKAREEGATDTDIVTHRLAYDYLRAALLTPPSDAGSTTPSGGEGVLKPCPACEGSGVGVVSDACFPCGGLGSVATTSSPDASPDSGEAERIIRQLREAGPKDYHNGTEWVGKPYNRDGEAAARLIERLLAPFPEAPANRQEAGEVRAAIPGDGSGYQAGLFMAATIADDGFANAGDESEQRMARQIAAAIREEWQHDFDARPALTSPKDVKGEA